jgi:hypothetical protein
MASTYINDLRLNEMATGDGSGTWGTTTNTNLELIAEAFSYGTEVITTNADTHTTTIADGATDPGRSLYLKYTGTLDSACTITIGPDTVSKVWIIENGTSGSQNIIISQGSGANITIPAGDTKVVYSDGAGAGAAFVDAFASLSVVDLKVQDDLTVTDDASIGGDATITGTLGVTGVFTGTSLDISGDIDVDGTTNLDVVDIDGAVDMASTALVTGVLTANGGAVFNETGADVDFRVESDTVDHALFVQGSDGNVGIGTASPGYKLDVSGASGVVAQINGPDAYNAESGLVFSAGRAKISGFLNGSGGTPGSSLRFYTMPDNGSVTERMRIISSGFVGIGETDPEAKLHLYTVGLEDGILVEGNDNNNVKIRLKNIGTGGEEWQAQVGLQGASNEGFHIRSNTANTNRLSIDSSGVLSVPAGYYVGGTAAANLLDDYEEGAWTPALNGIGTGTYVVQVGRYTKVGNLVTAHFHLDIGVLGTASGVLIITGLPFTASSVTDNYGSITTTHASGWDAGYMNLGGLVNSGTTNCAVYYQNSSGVMVAPTHANMQIGNFLGTLIYEAA